MKYIKGFFITASACGLLLLFIMAGLSDAGDVPVSKLIAGAGTGIIMLIGGFLGAELFPYKALYRIKLRSKRKAGDYPKKEAA